MQAMPHPCGLPVTKPSPARHTAAKAQLLGKFFPWNARAQHEQDAVERLLVTHSRAPTLGRRNEYRQQRCDLFEQRRADFSVFVSTHASINAAHAVGDDMVLLFALSRRAFSIPRTSKSRRARSSRSKRWAPTCRRHRGAGPLGRWPSGAGWARPSARLLPARRCAQRG